MGVYDELHSTVKPDQYVTQLNLPLITVDTMLKSEKLPKLVEDLVKEFVSTMHDSSLFVNKTFEELLFGYNDPVFDFLHKIMKDKVPPQFGLFYGYNNSDDGVYLVNTGKNDISKVNIIEKWNSKEKLNWWGTNETNMINGTDGVFMSSGITKNSTLYIYNSDICRSIYVTFDKETEVRGIKTWRFKVPAEVFQSPKKNDANKGFCINYPDNCLLDGVLEIATCKEGAPVVTSCPHFYMADPIYVKAVDGMNPQPLMHQTYLDIEPMSGAIFRANKRLQMNVRLKSSEIFHDMKNLKETIFPIAWLNESVYLDQNSSDMFKSEVVRNINIINSLQFIVLGIGILIILVVLVSIICKECVSGKKSEGYEPHVNIEESNSVKSYSTA